MIEIALVISGVSAAIIVGTLLTATIVNWFQEAETIWEKLFAFVCAVFVVSTALWCILHLMETFEV